MSGDNTKRPLEKTGEGREYRMSTGETSSWETIQIGHWRDRVRGDSTEQILKRPGVETQNRTATEEAR